MNKFGLKEIRVIRDKWASMPQEEVEAEQKKLIASAKRRMAQIRKKRPAASPVLGCAPSQGNR